MNEGYKLGYSIPSQIGLKPDAIRFILSARVSQPRLQLHNSIHVDRALSAYVKDSLDGVYLTRTILRQ